MRAKKNKENKGNNAFLKILKVAVFVICVGIVINLAPNYIENKLKGEVNLIINNNNVTESLKYDVIVDENEVIYISTKDIANFFDDNIYYDNKYNQIITTSETKVATIELNTKEMYVNSSKVKIYATAFEQDGTFYLPFSEMQDVYNVDINYSSESKIVTIDSLNKEQQKGNSGKNQNVKYKPTIFSKSVDKLKIGESVVVINEEDGWYKVRTSNGTIGYVKEVTNIYKTREDMIEEKQIDGTISIAWDYFTYTAPTRTEKIDGINVVAPSFVELTETADGEIKTKIGTAGENYINWAHSNGYKVWAMVANTSNISLTSEILNDYKIRENLINNIIEITTSYEIDGINIDFEYIKEEDKDMFTRFIIELAPRLKEYGKVLSVDVTAPDGAANWSLCYDRNEIAKVADYIVFMGYDQYGTSATEAGTTAGADWVETNIIKFIEREEVSKDKLILGMPLYTRLWKETSSGVTSSAILMKNIDSVLPSDVEKKWDENLKQYYVEYTKGDTTYKMWIEDEESLTAKLDLMNKYDLAGVAFWQKDFESENIWSIVAEKIN